MTSSKIARPSATAQVALCLAGGLAAAVAAAPNPGQDWPRFRGPDQNGAVPAEGALDLGNPGLEIEWKRPLGPGYSSISVVDGRGVTMFSDGTHDYLIAFDTATGTQLWRYLVSETYAGHSGTADGPTSTPAIHEGVVYGLGRHGHLFAVRLADGREIWSHRLEAAESHPPHFGFATTPVVAGRALVVLVGGEQETVIALDRATGTRLWSAGDDSVSYQSPLLFESGAHRHLIAVADHQLFGLDPDSGEIRWRHTHDLNPQLAFYLPLAVDERHLLVNSLHEVVALELEPRNGGFEIEELWRNNAFQRSFALPVHHAGFLYGFSSHFLTCVDFRTGEVMWRSRSAGGRGLILVDGHLVILTKHGDVVLVEATPEGYREKARLRVLESDDVTPASFAAGRIFVRNTREMASLKIVEGNARKPFETASETQGPELLGEFGKFIERLRQSEDKEKLIEELMAAQKSFPIIEEGGLVHFVYRGEARDVALVSNMEFSQEESFHRVEGTDFFFLSFELDPRGHWEYNFNVDLSGLSTDPLNPHVRSGSFERSELRMPLWSEPAHLAEPEGPRGHVDSLQFESEIRQNTREIRVYTPPAYGEGDRFPLLVVYYGLRAIESGLMHNTLDNLIGQKRIAPLVAVFLPRAGREYGGADTRDHVRMVTEELLPHLERHYRLREAPAARGIMGVGSAGMAALYTTFLVPGTFGRVATQSYYTTHMPSGDEILSLIKDGEHQEDLRFFVEWSTTDYKSVNLDAQAESRQLVEVLREEGYEVRSNEAVGGPGWGNWRAQTDLILETLFPLAKDAPSGE